MHIIGIYSVMDTCICTAEFLHCSPGTIATLLVGYTPIQNRSLEKQTCWRDFPGGLVADSMRHCRGRQFQPWSGNSAHHMVLPKSYHVWNRSPARVDAWGGVLGAGALGWPRGMGWGGRWAGGSGWGTLVHPWRIHVNVWQNHYNIVK